MSKRKVICSVVFVLASGMVLWHCSPPTPAGLPRGTSCVRQSDCGWGTVCRHSICELGDLKDTSTESNRRDGGHSDDLDGPDILPPAPRGRPDGNVENHGRFADAAQTTESFEDEGLGEVTSGRNENAIPDRVPPPRRAPDSVDTGADDKDSQGSPGSCKTDSKRDCYPEETVGCNEKSLGFSCITPCAPGQQTCKGGIWGTCEGARTPKTKTECTRPKGGNPCPDGKKDVNGRCI